MWSLAVRRLLLVPPTLLAVSLFAFSLIHVIPGDPAELVLGLDATPEQIARLRLELGLDEPLPVQFGRWLLRVVHGNLGQSIRSGRPVLTELIPRFLATLELAGASLVVAVVLGLGAGLVASLARDSLYDLIVTATALVGISVPRFWLGMMLVLVFSVSLGALPSGGRGGLLHLVLPAIAFGWSPGAFIARTTRASMLEVLDRDYIRTARAKGLHERSVVLKHALRAALLPTVTVLGLQFGFLLAGSVIVEIVFSWPGIGTLLVDSIVGRDYPVVQAALLLLATCFVIVNLAVDLLYLVIDPRLRLHTGPAGRA